MPVANLRRLFRSLRLSAEAGRDEAGNCGLSAVCDVQTATRKPLSLRHFVPCLEVAEALQVVGSASQRGGTGQANDRKPECGYSYARS